MYTPWNFQHLRKRTDNRIQMQSQDVAHLKDQCFQRVCGSNWHHVTRIAICPTATPLVVLFFPPLPKGWKRKNEQPRASIELQMRTRQKAGPWKSEREQDEREGGRERRREEDRSRKVVNRGRDLGDDWSPWPCWRVVEVVVVVVGAYQITSSTAVQLNKLNIRERN